MGPASAALNLPAVLLPERISSAYATSNYSWKNCFRSSTRFP